MVDTLAQSIMKDGQVRDPIMVDEKSLVVLDGMHRVTAVAQVGCKRIPCCLVDYGNSSIRIGCWVRVLRGRRTAREIMISTKRDWPQSNLKEAIGLIESGAPIVAMSDGQSCYISKSLDAFEAYEKVAYLEDIAQKMGFDISYEMERQAQMRLAEGSAKVLIVPPVLTKSQVLDLALSGKLLPHKSTRHVFPARPLGVNVPLDLLKEDSDEAADRLVQLLNERRVKFMPQGSSKLERNYDEDIYLLE